MSRSTNPTLLSTLALVLAFTLVSCGQSTTQETASSTNTPPATTASEPVTVVAVDLGKSIGSDQLVVERVEEFKPNDTIYASVRTSGAAPTATVEVKWIAEDGQVVEQSEQTIVPQGSTATAFQISKPEGLRAGVYRVEVSVDGSPAQTREFRVTTG